MSEEEEEEDWEPSSGDGGSCFLDRSTIKVTGLVD